MSPGDLVRVVSTNRAHGGKVGIVLRVYSDKPHILDVLIDGKVKERANKQHFEVVSEGG
jgi:hypothetical protein